MAKPRTGPRTRTTRERISIAPGCDYRIVAVADSHSRPHPDAHRWITALKPDLILHAGDIGDLDVLEPLRDVAKVVWVRGNVDGRGPTMPDTVAVELVSDGETAFVILLTHIAVYGPRLLKSERAAAEEAGANLVICGHSHVPLIAQEGQTAVFNPGSYGPRRFHLPITFGVIDLRASGVSLRHIDCETGDEWVPPAAVS